MQTPSHNAFFLGSQQIILKSQSKKPVAAFNFFREALKFIHLAWD